MSAPAVTVRLDSDDHALLAAEANRLGVRPGTLARMLIRSALRPADLPLVAVPSRSKQVEVGTPATDPALRERILEVATRHGARKVRVFGSVARGEAGPGADLDLLVEMEPGRDLLDLVALSEELEELVGHSVDVLADGGVSPHLRERIYAGAVPL